MGEKGQPANTASASGVTANSAAVMNSTGAGVATAAATGGGVSAGVGSNMVSGAALPGQAASLGGGTQGPTTSTGAQVPGQDQNMAVPSGEKGLDVPHVGPELPPNPALGLL